MSLGSLHSSSCKRSYFRISFVEKKCWMLESSLKIEVHIIKFEQFTIHITKLGNGLVLWLPIQKFKHQHKTDLWCLGKIATIPQAILKEFLYKTINY